MTTGEYEQLTTPDGAMPAYVASPGRAAHAGVVVVQEAFGVTPHIEDVCRRLAGEGYVAVAPALFHRSGAPVFEYGDLASVMPVMQQLRADGIAADVEAALGVLDARGIAPDHRGIVGFCMGGTVALFAATRFALGAAVTFYGGGVTQGRFGFPPLVDLAPDLRAPWLGLYGDRDQGIPVDDVEALRHAAAQAAVGTEIVRYPEAQHGFHCDDRPAAYDADAAADAWRRTLGWFATHLGRPG